jgi:tRNA threonylcarbamoyladenosine biosynthesis protein TsaE
LNAQLKIEVASLSQLPSVSSRLLEFSKDKRIFLFEAPMGAGKTTLIKELCRALGSEDHFGSPTFSIVNEYKYPGGTIYHFDLYRISELNELYDIGIEEYLDSGEYCFIEWPGIIKDNITQSYIIVRIDPENELRHIQAEVVEAARE